MIFRPTNKKHNRIKYLKELIPIIIGLEVHGSLLRYLFKIRGIWARIIGNFSD